MEIRISPISGTRIFCRGWDGRVYDLKACLIQELNFSRRLWSLFSHNSTLYFQFHALNLLFIWSMNSTLQYMYDCKVHESIELIKMYNTGTCTTGWTRPGLSSINETSKVIMTFWINSCQTVSLRIQQNMTTSHKKTMHILWVIQNGREKVVISAILW